MAPDGHEIERFPQVPFNGDNGSGVPFDTVSSAMFLGTRLMVANQSYFTGDATHQAILDVEAGEDGLPEYIPPAPAPPRQQVVKHRKRRHRHHKRRRHRRD